ncbi:MAG: hypothetical protein Q9200_004665 [Gallowayella weberi]
MESTQSLLGGRDLPKLPTPPTAEEMFQELLQEHKIVTIDPDVKPQDFAEILFSMGENTSIRGYSFRSPYVRPFLDFMNKELQERAPRYSSLLQYCGLPHEVDQSNQLRRFVGMLVMVLKKSKYRQISIDKVLYALRLSNGLPLTGDDELAPELRQGVFSLLGLITMLYKIEDQAEVTELYISQPLNPTIYYNRKPIEEAGTALGTLIRSFGKFVPILKEEEPRSLEEWPPKEPEPLYLNINAVNAYALLKVAKIRIEWSDLLSEHLLFDRHLRTVKLFCFPTFCALHYLPEDKRSGFDCIMDHWRFEAPLVIAAHRPMFREALLSYRVLFGQDDHARALFKGEEEAKALYKGVLDPLLVRLCGSKESLSDLVVDKSIHEQEFYDCTIDIPFYGRRLNTLQMYTTTRQPRNLKDLWHDRRDPSKWALLWVALMVAGCAVVLSILQIGLVTAQLVIAILRR